MEFVLTDLQKVTLTTAFVTSTGVNATIHGVPVWESTDPAGATVEPAADGMSCVVRSADNVVNPITYKIRCTADADMGSGVRHITEEMDFQTVHDQSADAQSVNLSAGTVEPK